jgi:hypothetical protein
MENAKLEKQKKKIGKIFDNKKERQFFLACLEYGVDYELITNLFKKKNEYKTLLQNEDINIESLIPEKIKSHFDTFEMINDTVEKTIRKQKAKSLLKSVISGKYKKLINDKTEKIFLALSEKNITKKEISNKVTKKIASFYSSEDLNIALEKELLSDWNLAYYKDKIKDLNVSVIEEKDNSIFLKVSDFNSMRELGSSLWCVTRETTYFNHYTTNFNELNVILDFNKPESDVESKIALLTSAKGHILEAYDKEDYKIEKTKYVNKYGQINEKSFDDILNLFGRDIDINNASGVFNTIIKENIMENRRNLRDFAYLEGYEKEVHELADEHFDYVLNSNKKVSLFYNKIVDQGLTKYLSSLDKFDKKEKDSFVYTLFQLKLEEPLYGEPDVETLVYCLSEPELKDSTLKMIKSKYKEMKDCFSMEDLEFYKTIMCSYMFSAFNEHKSKDVLEEIDNIFEIDYTEKVSLLSDGLNDICTQMALYSHNYESKGMLWGYDYLNEEYGDFFLKSIDNQDEFTKVFDYSQRPELLERLVETNKFPQTFKLLSAKTIEASTKYGAQYNKRQTENIKNMIDYSIENKTGLMIDMEEYSRVVRFSEKNGKAKEILNSFNKHIENSSVEYLLSKQVVFNIFSDVNNRYLENMGIMTDDIKESVLFINNALSPKIKKTLIEEKDKYDFAKEFISLLDIKTEVKIKNKKSL